MQSIALAVQHSPGCTPHAAIQLAGLDKWRRNWSYAVVARAIRAGLVEQRAHPTRRDWSSLYPSTVERG